MLLTLLIIIISIYLIFSLIKGEKYPIDIAILDQKSPYEIWLTRFFWITLILIFATGGSYYINRPSFCSNCHDSNMEIRTLKQSVHKNIACLNCHQPATASGTIVQKIDYARWFYKYTKNNGIKSSESLKANIDNSSCLKCHSNISSQVVSKYDVRVRHRDFLEIGSKCVECHNTIAHQGIIKPERTPSMDYCIKCHDDIKASSDCKTCHINDVGKTSRIAKRETLKVGVKPAWNFCYRCHADKNCTKCHGVTMPHPPDWMSEAKHARPAFTNRQVCWRCHDIPSAPLKPALLQSCSCHGTMQYHGSQDTWRKDHGPIALGVKPGNGENQYCYDCHSVKLCDHCHETGKYKPKQGYSVNGPQHLQTE